MPLVTAGAIATGLGIVWNYWRVPYRFYKWRIAEEVEPEVGQHWREASTSAANKDWKITEVEEDSISIESTTDQDSLGNNLKDSMDWDTWETFVTKRRLYCHDKKDTIHDTYWGEHAEK